MGRSAFLFLSCILLLSLIQSPITVEIVRREPETTQASLTLSLYDSLATDFDDYLWPTDAGRLVTSVFAEYRSTHFHGGIDISTGDDTGFRVFAARDGYVSRIVVGPTGYGTMLWLRHANGYYTTYAHLRNFNEALDRFVAAEQQRLERFPIDIECGPADFPVKKGDLIAYTGETGTGSPHLHFEIRDTNKNFVNPLLCRSFTFPDNIAPSIYAVAVTPLGEGSFINNAASSRVIGLRRPANGKVVLAETLYASGSLGIAVDARDRIDGSRFRNGVYGHDLFLDDSLVFSVRLDRAPAGDDFQVGLHFDFALMAEEGGRLAKLYVDSPNRLPFYLPRSASAGIINTALFPEGPHRFRVVTHDFARNASEVSGTIVFSHSLHLSFSAADRLLQFEFDEQRISHLQFYTTMNPGRAGTFPRWRPERVALESGAVALSKIRGAYDVLKIVGRDKFGSRTLPLFYSPPKKNLPAAEVEVEHEVKADMVSFSVRTDGVFNAPPSVVLLEGDSSRLLNVFPVEFNHYGATFIPQPSHSAKRTIVVEYEANGRLGTTMHDLTIYPILPEAPTSVSFDNDNLRVIAPYRSVYKPVFLTIEKNAHHEGRSYSLLPRHAVLDQGITIMVRADTARARQALFFQRRSSWVLLSTQREGGYFVGTLRRTPGTVAVLTDDTPPQISRLKLPTSYARQPHDISFSVRDDLVGVEYNELKLYIDGVFAIPNIDGEHRRVTHRFARPLARGSHHLVILLQDRLGNTTEIRRTFAVR